MNPPQTTLRFLPKLGGLQARSQSRFELKLPISMTTLRAEGEVSAESIGRADHRDAEGGGSGQSGLRIICHGKCTSFPWRFNNRKNPTQTMNRAQNAAVALLWLFVIGASPSPPPIGEQKKSVANYHARTSEKIEESQSAPAASPIKSGPFATVGKRLSLPKIPSGPEFESFARIAIELIRL